jgi:predicted nuclease of predicted toxin-antitoxin system
MKLLLDANISWKLTGPLSEIFRACSHVDKIGISVPAQDINIWTYAKENDYIIVTKDSDFVDLLEVKGFPPKIVLLKTGNNSSKAIMELLVTAKESIRDLSENDYGLLEIVNGYWSGELRRST